MSEKQKTILIVDDIEDVREGLSEILVEEGYSVSTASSGNVAMDVLEDMSVDLVITDVLMPDMDGIELAKKLKALYPKIKCMLISGGGRKLDEEYNYLGVAKRLTGVKTTLKKPFKPSELIETVANLLSE